MKTFLRVAALLVLLLPELARADGVILYSDANYRGQAQALGPGRHDLAELAPGVGNDTVSSLQVSPGFRVVLYEHAGFHGRTMAVTQDTPWVGDFNDITSSVEVIRVRPPPGVIVYSDANFQGRAQELGLGRHDTNELAQGIGNDTLSSLRIPPGLTVTLYENTGFRGRRKVFSGDTPWVGDDFNDTASAVEVSPTAPVNVVEVAPPADPVSAVSSRDLQSIIQAINGQAFSQGKLDTLRLASSGRFFTADQTGTILDQFPFSQDKLSALRMLKPMMVDRQNAFTILSHLTFDSDKAAAQQILAQ